LDLGVERLGRQKLEGYYDIHVRPGTRTGKRGSEFYQKVYLGDYDALMDQLENQSFLGFTYNDEQIIIPVDRVDMITNSFVVEVDDLTSGTSEDLEEDLLDEDLL
jgi:hypothetical protein